MTGTVVDEIRSRAERFAGNVAILEGARALTYPELFERVDRLSQAFSSLGLVKGDAVLAYLPNTTAAVECELAVLQSGLVWITLNSRLTWAEVRGVLASCAPRLVVTDGDGLARVERGIDELAFAPLPRLVAVGGAADSALEPLDYEALVQSTAPVRPSVVVAPGDVARLRYTSGTTGSAKAAVLPHRVYHASLENLNHELYPFTESDRALHVAPLTHGSGALLYPVLHAGGTNVLAHQFDAEGMLEAMEAQAITVLFTVPTILTRLVSARGFESTDLSALRALIYGGAPMPEAQLRAAAAKIGRALVQIYGMTEAPWPITMLKPADHAPPGPRLASVGKPTTICTVRVVDDAGHELPAGGVGEIQIRGKNVMSGYFRDDEATARVLNSGWLSSGDVGRFDDEGYLYIVGRAKDVIISGGFNVYAAEVEAALSTHDGILEVAVVGAPHDEWGEQVVAFIVPRPGATLSETSVQAFAKSLLSGYKCPKSVEIVPDLPKNPSGKIQKGELSAEWLTRRGLARSS
jgi:acyl-CoA synthetase (AMP-forming)/AMP-acid ligase II